MLKKFFIAMPLVLAGIATASGALFVNMQKATHPKGAAPVQRIEEKPSFPSLENTKTTPETLKAFEVDSDGDGLTDFVEAFYGTDLHNPDSDRDGYLDGQEVAKGYNPKGPGRLQ